MDKPAVRVLLVDDDEDEYVIVGDLLRAASADSYDLSWTSTYDQGLEAILATRCDVCLVDYRLGQRSGLELLAEVTAKSGHAQIIFLTGAGNRDLDVIATQAGAADYLIKGEVTAAVLERSIRYAVERGRTQKALRNATAQAQASNQAKSAFLASMSHEMRTPMNAILGMADVLLESPLNTEQVQYVEVIRRAGAGLLLLINDILDLSKIEAGHLQLERVAFDLEEVMDQAIELTAVKARDKGIMLLSRLAPGVETCLVGDPAKLKQVLINLLGNAVKFTDSGEIVLTVRNDESGKPGHMEIAVSDTGIGIPADKLETIFDDFTQADASTTRKYGGTGLGLGISRRLVEAMGGRLTATGSVGKGSTFGFTIQFDPAPEDACDVCAALTNHNGKRVLLIDVNETHSLMLREKLQTCGLESDVFRLPVEALACLAENMAGKQPYSLAIVSDSCATGVDGFETAADIKRIAGELPIVLLACETRPGDFTRSAQAGLAGYAVKPVARGQLVRLVNEAIETPVRPETDPILTLDREEKEPVKPARILVAEDSPDNRLLIQLYMKDSPYQLTFAENGEAAVEQFVTSDFDLILMDMRMPVMDGLTATRAIRTLERERGLSPILIIALTANASLQDLERSGEAGCNAHLSKPISKLELLSSIEKWRRLKPAVEVAQPVPLEPIKIEITPGLEEIVPSYLASRREEVPEMLKLLAASDFDRLATLGHNLKGSGGAYGFPELTRFGATLERFAKQEDGAALRTQMTGLGHYLDQVQLVADRSAG